MKTLHVLLLVAAIAGGIWFLKSRNIDVFSQVTGNQYAAGIVRGAEDLWNNAKNSATDFLSKKSAEIKKYSDKAVEAAKKKGVTAVDAQKNLLVDSAKNTADNFLTTVANDVKKFLGLTPGGTSTANLADTGTTGVLFGTVIKRGEPLTLVVGSALFKKYGASEISYDASWGDGDKEHHTIYADAKNKLITHAFEKIGEYEPLFNFVAGSDKIQYKITVVVQ
jgi:hypothetical protein